MSHSMSDFAAWAERCSDGWGSHIPDVWQRQVSCLISGLGGEESAGTPIPKCRWPTIVILAGAEVRDTETRKHSGDGGDSTSCQITRNTWVCTVCVLLSENGGCTPKWNQSALWMRKLWLTINHRIQGYPRVTGSWMPNTLAHTDQPKTSWHLVPQINGKEAAQKFLSRGGF